MPKPPKHVVLSRKQIGQRLRALRQARDMTQVQLAAILGTQQTAISQVELGHRGLTVQQVVKLAHALQVPRERVLIVAGRGDRIVPPEHPNALWRHWGEPNIFWFSGSHLAPFARPRIVRAIVHHLEDLEIL